VWPRKRRLPLQTMNVFCRWDIPVVFSQIHIYLYIYYISEYVVINKLLLSFVTTCCYQHKEFPRLSTGNTHQVTQCHFQKRCLVKALCALWGDTVTEPRVVEGRATAADYRNFMENEWPVYLDGLPVGTRDKYGYSMTDVRERFDTEFMAFLNESCEGRWVGRLEGRGCQLRPLGHPAWTHYMLDLRSSEILRSVGL
jgi:hypothetical protein